MCNVCTSSIAILATCTGAIAWIWHTIKFKLNGDKKNDNDINTTTR